MSTRVVLAIGLAFAVLSASITPVVGVGNAPIDRSDAALSPTGDGVAQYKVSLDNVTIETWLLRNATVLNATVDEVVIRNATTTDGSRTNVTLTNATVGKFVLERGRLKNVTARRLVVRNKSLLNIPGGEVIDPKVENRTIKRHWTKNQTVSGVVIDRISIDAAFLCGNATLGSEAGEDASIAPQAGDEKPDIVVEKGTVGEALIIRGEVMNWSVGSIQQPDATDVGLPNGCSRG